MIKIIPWNETHVPFLTSALRGFFEAGYDRGGDVLPTERNISAFIKLGIGGARRGDPCLVATVDDIPAGFVLWVGTEFPVLDSRWKTIQALGSFTEFSFRSRGVADTLRKEALRVTRERGYERILGPVHMSNPRGISEFIFNYDAWPTTVTFEKFVN